MSFLKNNSIMLLQKNLDFTWQRQITIMDNLANVETPGYKAKYVTFEDEFKKRLSGGNKKGSEFKSVINDSKMKMNYTNDESTKADGNNVNVDVESMELARTLIQYQFSQRLINDEFSRLSMAIKGQ